MQFDFADIDTKTLSNAGVDMTIKRLNSDAPLVARNGKPVTIRVLGPDSDVYRECTRKAVQKRLARAAEKREFSEQSFEEIEAESLDMLSTVTIGWSNVLDPTGAEIPFSREAARALYEAYPVVREQVDIFVADRARFLKASSGN